MYATRYGIDVYVSMNRDSEATYVEVHAPLYMKTYWRMPHCYGPQWTDQQILKDRDFTRVLSQHYG